MGVPGRYRGFRADAIPGLDAFTALIESAREVLDGLLLAQPELAGNLGPPRPLWPLYRVLGMNIQCREGIRSIITLDLVRLPSEAVEDMDLRPA